MANAATSADVTVVVRWGSFELAIRDGLQSCDWTDNFTAVNRSRLGQQGQNVDQLYENTTGTIQCVATSESYDQLRDIVRVAVLARTQKVGSVTKTTFYPATGRKVVNQMVLCAFSLSESISGVAEQQVTISFTTGTMPSSTTT